MDETTLLRAECIVAVMGIPYILKKKLSPPSQAKLDQAAKLPATIKRRVGELVDMTRQGKQSGPPELPDYAETSEALITGPDLDAMPDALVGLPDDVQIAATATWTRGIEYLSSRFPRRIEQRLTGPYEHDPSAGEWAEFGWCWRISDSPLYVLDLAGDGMLIGVEIQHLSALFPAIYAEISGAIFDALADKVANDKTWQAPWWLQKQLCTILGVSPVSTSLVTDIDTAIKQSQSETKMRASSLKLSQTGKTMSDRLAGDEAR